MLLRRTPRWVRGLKFMALSIALAIFNVAPHDGCVDWNSKKNRLWDEWHHGRTPRWVRGLKSSFFICRIVNKTSHPTMGAWIEIAICRIGDGRSIVAPHDGCVDWNLLTNIFVKRQIKSHPTMGAWIEISFFLDGFYLLSVAPHDGCVDWNYWSYHFCWHRHLSHPTMGAWI